MRSTTVRTGLAIAVLMCIPQLATADIVYPRINGNIDPSTVTWFYGCTDALPSGACVTAGVGRMMVDPPHFPWTLFYDFSQLKTPGGTEYMIYDRVSWRLPDGSCAGVEDSFAWSDDSCFISNLQSEQLLVSLDWTAPFPAGYQRTPVLLTALVAPEPTSLALVATGLILVAVQTTRRKRRYAALNAGPRRDEP
jgi:hypothetical protein